MKKSIFLSFCALSLSLFSSCKDSSQNNTPQSQAPVEVDIITAVPENIPINTLLPGRLEPYRQAEVRARVTGIVEERCYEEGQNVKEGELLFKIDRAPLQANYDGCAATLASTEANLNDFRDKLNRYKSLANEGAVSKREHILAAAGEARAKADRDAALAALKKAELELGYTNVTSPIDGIARRAFVTEGAYVNQNESTHLTTIEQINPIYLRFSQPIGELNERQQSIHSGKWEEIPLDKIQVTLILPNGDAYPQTGKLFFSDRAVDPKTDTVEMRAEFPNAQQKIFPGTYVRASFDSAMRKNIFRIPRDAVMRTSLGASVFIVNDKDTIEILPVKTELLEGKNWIITEGLKGGERIVTSKHSGLYPQTPVKISPSTTNTTETQPAQTASSVTAIATP